MPRDQTMKQLTVIYVAWKLGVQIQSRYKPDISPRDEWSDHAMYRYVVAEEELDSYWLHKVVIDETVTSDSLEIIYRIPPQDQR